jgi:hypothetical protein
MRVEQSRVAELFPSGGAAAPSPRREVRIMSIATSQLGRSVGANTQETRQRIITAIMRCVADAGYSKASIRDIARAARTTSARAHYCIGANLARITINLIFKVIADQMPDLQLSPPERLRSGWLNGIKHWQVDYTGGTDARSAAP